MKLEKIKTENNKLIENNNNINNFLLYKKKT